MTCRLLALGVDANDPIRLAGFWADLLGWGRADESRDVIELVPTDDTGFRIRLVPSRHRKGGQNSMHFDLTSSSLDDQRQSVAKALELGARHIDVGQRPEQKHVVLADPEGNEFCVIEPGNRFLADCGFIGALACDGSQAVGYFWRDVLGWPLVWDQDQETAIRSPHGGPKLTWGGTPPVQQPGKNRLRFHLAPPVNGDLSAELVRLVSLGACRVESGASDPTGLVMTDPDGNAFCLS